VQIAAILSVIAVHGRPFWVEALVYATVAVTVASGLDYFFDLRRRLDEARATRTRHTADA
jgi:CDP-diacylglycerol--glycerol-3-phosphate 3-phosphatidyltransferase